MRALRRVMLAALMAACVAGAAVAADSDGDDICLHIERDSPASCGDPYHALELEVRNDCSRPKRVQMCILRKTGKWACAEAELAVGESASHRVCFASTGWWGDSICWTVGQQGRGFEYPAARPLFPPSDHCRPREASDPDSPPEAAPPGSGADSPPGAAEPARRIDSLPSGR